MKDLNEWVFDRILPLALLFFMFAILVSAIQDCTKTKWEALEKISENGIKIEIRLEKSDE